MLDFPNNPVQDQLFSSSDARWQYDGTKWIVATTPEAAREFAILAGPRERPGDVPELFGMVKTGAAETIPQVDPDWVAVSLAGNVLRIDSAVTDDPQSVVPLTAFPIEAGYVYEVRFVVQRQTDPIDPLNDSVSCGVRWLTNTLAGVTGFHGQSVAENIPLTVAQGVQQRIATLATRAAPGVDFVAPVGTIYFRPFIDLYGDSHLTDVIVIEVVRIEPISPKPVPFILRILAADPAMGPGIGLAWLYAVEPTPGKVSLRMQAGTSTEAFDMIVDVDTGV
jgi:hypothetical protein